MSGLPDLEKLVAQLRGDLFARWMARAQKAALLEWRDRTVAPGLAARFTHAGNAFYRYPKPQSGYVRRKGNLPDYVFSGRFRDTVTKRTPRTIRGTKADVTTRLAFGGGVLNFLTDKFPILRIEKPTESIPVLVKGYTYTNRRGTTITVAAHASKHSARGKRIHGSESYAAAYGRFDQDRPWINNRVGELFQAIFRASALTKNGQLRSSVLEGADNGGR